MLEVSCFFCAFWVFGSGFELVFGFFGRGFGWIGRGFRSFVRSFVRSFSLLYDFVRSSVVTHTAFFLRGFRSFVRFPIMTHI